MMPPIFRKVNSFVVWSFACVSLVWGCCFLCFTKRDLQKYLRVDAREPSSLLASTEQNRTSVVKEIYFTQEDNTRLHYRIASASSFLTLRPEKQRFVIDEKLQDIQCWMQDKLYYDPNRPGVPMQQVRFLEAKDGIYRYAAQEFLAQTVAISLCRMVGHDLPQSVRLPKPFLQGVADDVSFAVSGKVPQFNAHHFRALIDTPREVSHESS